MTKWIVSLLVVCLSTQTFAYDHDSYDSELDHSEYNQHYDEASDAGSQDAHYYEPSVYGDSVQIMEGHDPLPPPPAPPSDTPPPRPPSRPEPPPTTPGNPPVPNPPPAGQEYAYSLGAGELGRFKTREYTFYPRQDLNRITRIRLIGIRNEIEIKEVIITYADTGYEERAYMLTGDLGASRVKEAWGSGRPIRSIKIRASANGIFKKPGGFRLDVTAVR